MKCFPTALLSVVGVLFVSAAEIQIRDELMAVAEQISLLKTLHKSEISQLKKEIQELK